jgi:hypothetical protein
MGSHFLTPEGCADPRCGSNPLARSLPNESRMIEHEIAVPGKEIPDSTAKVLFVKSVTRRLSHSSNHIDECYNRSK